MMTARDEAVMGKLPVEEQEIEISQSFNLLDSVIGQADRTTFCSTLDE